MRLPWETYSESDVSGDLPFFGEASLMSLVKSRHLVFQGGRLTRASSTNEEFFPTGFRRSSSSPRPLCCPPLASPHP